MTSKEVGTRGGGGGGGGGKGHGSDPVTDKLNVSACYVVHSGFLSKGIYFGQVVSLLATI